MPVHITRAMLQVLYLERFGSPRAPNTLRELLGTINVRSGDGETPLERKTLNLLGAAYLADDPATRAIKIYTGADIVIEPAISGTQHNYRPTDWDDASIVALTLSGGTTITGFDVFSCRRQEKLIMNVSGGTLTIAHNSSSSHHDNRILCPEEANLSLLAGRAAWLIRDPVSARWRVQPAGAGGFSGVIDSILAAGGALPNAAYSISHRLYSGYSGPLFRLRETAGGTEVDVGFDGAGFVNTALIASHCSGTTGTVVTIYDQTGNGRHLTQATPANQPEIYASGAIHVVGGLPVTLHVGGAGTGGTGQGWSRGDAGGFSGDQALSIWAFASITDTSTSARSIVNIGAGASAFTFRHILSQGLGANNNTGSGSGNYRAFSLGTAVGTLSDYLVTSAASGNMSAVTLYQRGASQSQSSVSAGTYSIATTDLSIGANEVEARGMTGAFNSAILSGYVASGGVKTAGDTFGTSLRSLAGV